MPCFFATANLMVTHSDGSWDMSPLPPRWFMSDLGTNGSIIQCDICPFFTCLELGDPMLTKFCKLTLWDHLQQSWWDILSYHVIFGPKVFGPRIFWNRKCFWTRQLFRTEFFYLSNYYYQKQPHYDFPIWNDYNTSTWELDWECITLEENTTLALTRWSHAEYRFLGQCLQSCSVL